MKIATVEINLNTKRDDPWTENPHDFLPISYPPYITPT